MIERAASALSSTTRKPKYRPLLAHGTFEAHRQQPLRLDCEFHWEFLQDLLTEPIDDQVDRVRPKHNQNPPC